MSRILEELPKDGRGAPQIYPWSDWTDGRVWEITRGVDFNGPAARMAGQMRNYALRNGLKVKQRVRADTVSFQFARPA